MVSACTVAAASTALLSACGGGDDDGDGQEDFLAEVDAVCAQTSTEIEEVYAKAGAPQNITQLDALLEKRLPISAQAQERVEGIEPPDELVAEFEQYLSQRRELIALLQEQKKAAGQSDDARASELDQEIAEANERHTTAAAEVGLGICADKPVAEDEEFTAKIDEVCVTSRHRVVDLFEQRGNPRTLPEYAAIFPERVQIAADRQQELSEVAPPEALAADYRKLVEGGDAELAALEDALRAAEANDQKAFDLAARQLDQGLTDLTDAGFELGSYPCAGELPSDQEADLRATIEDIWLNADPAHCTEDYTRDFVEQLGGQEACERSEKPAIEADSVEMGEIAGVGDIEAQVDVTVHGGSHDGETATEYYLYEDGRWKLDLLAPLSD